MHRVWQVRQIPLWHYPELCSGQVRKEEHPPPSSSTCSNPFERMEELHDVSRDARSGDAEYVSATSGDLIEQLAFLAADREFLVQEVLAIKHMLHT